MALELGIKENGLGKMNDLPDIHEQIAEVMTYFRGLVNHSRQFDYPSVKDKQTLELTDLWLSLQKEAAMAVVPWPRDDRDD